MIIYNAEINGELKTVKLDGGKIVSVEPDTGRGDIDAGGFRMFSRLQREIIPELKPYRMDRDTLKAFRGQAMEIQSEAYLKLLEDMGQNPEYEIFHDVIQLMIRERIRLEQESMAIGEGYDVI